MLKVKDDHNMPEYENEEEEATRRSLRSQIDQIITIWLHVVAQLNNSNGDDHDGVGTM